MTKLTFRLTTELDKDYINQMIGYMITDYEHGLLTGLEVDVSGDEGTCRIRRDRKKRGRRRLPKELEIPEFMKRPTGQAADGEHPEEAGNLLDGCPSGASSRYSNF
ncbi:MAG: hypothetical protein NC409_12500 [Clostridium sp.]|nr:hypothetical protein [Clostridium sp.]